MSAFSRRAFLGSAAALAAVPLALAKKKVPVGLEMYSVRDDLKRDPMGTVRAVAKLGFECVEFYAPYLDWTADFAKQMRKTLDESGVRCFSTHNSPKSFTPESLPHAIELNQILGSEYIILASAGKISTVDGWKGIAETLTRTAEQLRPVKLHTGYHNHKIEFETIEGTLPMQVLAQGTPKDVMLQLDVGACLEAGADPVAWINGHPGRVGSLHVKDWSSKPDVGFKVMLGEGNGQWKQIFAAAEKTGGVKFYLIEQEGSEFTAIDSAARCLKNFRALHA